MRLMKNSGIEWIGEIPSDWKLPKVKKLFKIGRGRVIAVTEMNPDGKYPVFSSQTKNDGCLGYIDTYDFDQDQLTWTTDGANAGTVFLRRGKHNCTNVCGTLLPYTNDNDLRFLKYSLEYIAIFHKRADINGFKIMNNEMADIVITLPPLSEQIVIADYLDKKCAEIDTVIEQTKVTIGEYKKLKQSVITQAVTKGICSNRPMKDSGIEWIGEIPADWDKSKIKNIVLSLESGVSVNAADIPVENSTQFGVLKTSSVSKFLFVPSEHKQVNIEEYERVSCPVRKNTIIVSRMNTPELVGACGYVDDDYPNLFLPDRLWQITLSESIVTKFVWYYLINQKVRSYISSLSSGTSSSMQNISKPQFDSIILLLPNKSEQQEIVNYLDKKCSEIDELIAKKTSLLSELESYKKSLIYEYVTGKKEVK